MSETLVVFPSKQEFNALFPKISAVVASSTPVSVDGRYDVAVCGVGLVNSAAGMSRFLSTGNYKRVFLLGICGAYLDRGLDIGEVVRVDSEVIGDMGAQNFDGHFIPWRDISKQEEVFVGETTRYLPLMLASIRSAVGVSVNCCTGTSYLSLKRAALFDADVESMEGASVFAICKAFRVPVFEFRAVSNVAADRDPSQWKITEAMTALKQRVLDYL